MAEDSVVLIADFIVPDPVPANEIGAASASMSMMAPAGKERTIEDFRKVLDGAGLQLTGVFQSQDDNFGLIEARLKPTSPLVDTLSDATLSTNVSPIEGGCHEVISLPLDAVGLKSDAGLMIIDD